MNPWEEFQEAPSAKAPWEEFSAAPEKEAAPWEQFASQEDYSNEGRAYQRGASAIPGAEAGYQKTYKNKDTLGQKVQAVGDVFNTLLSGAVAGPVGGLIGLGQTAVQGGDAKANMEAAADALMYKPKQQSDTYDDIMQSLNPAMETLQAMGMGYHTGTGGMRRLALERERVKNTPGAGVDAVLKKSAPPPVEAVPEQVVVGPENITPRERRIYEQVEAGKAREAQGQRPITVDRVGEAVLPDTDSGTLMAREQATQRMSDQLDAQAREQRLAEQPPRVTDDLNGQADLFEQGNPTPYTLENGQWHVDENGMPIRSDLSMEANALEQPLQRGLWGEELGPSLEQQRGLTQAIDSMPPGPERMGALERLGDVRTDEAILAATADQLKTPRERLAERYSDATLEDTAPIDPAIKEGFYGKDGNVQIRPTATGFEAVIGDKVVGKLESNMTPEQNAQLRAMGEKIPATADIVKVDPALQGQGIGSALQNAWRAAHEDNIAPHGNTTQAAWNMWKRNMPEKVQEFVTSEADRIKSGADEARILSNITDPQVRQQVVESVKAANAIVDVATGEVPLVSEWRPVGGSRGRKQGGYIVLPGRKKPAAEALKRMDVFKDKMKNFLPETLTNEDFLAKYGNTPDIDQSMLQRATNSFTKGGLYLAEKTNNPFVKRVTERFREATNTSQAMIRDVIHDDQVGYASLARAVSKEELPSVAQLLQRASREQIDIDLGAMREQGFSDNAIKMVAQHQDAMKMMEQGPLAEAMKANGIQNVNMRTAYAAASAKGDFRRVVYSATDPNKVIGILSANTKMGLNKIVKAYEAQEGAGKVGETRYFGGNKGRAGTSEGFQQMLEFLSQNDPDIKAFVEHAADALQGDAKNFMNVKKHTMEKRGVFGMEGDKFHKDAYTNAKDFFDAQVGYMENVIRWSEMSKAVSDTKEIVAAAKPNAKALIDNYVDGALGKNPAAWGRGLDNLMSGIGDSLGIGTTKGSELMNAVKKITNVKLLSFNLPFIATQIVQPFKVMPEMTQFLAARGLNTSVINGYASLGKAMVTMLKEEMGHNLDGVTKGALEYANKNHVYASDLFENSNRVRNDFGFKFDKYTQKGAASAEYVTRKGIYLSFVDMLHENGLKPKEGLYEAAQNLTDVSMNNYNTAEAPQFYNSAGSAGRASYNLLSYKHNELSRMAMLGRDLPNNQYGRALATNIASQVAFAGIMGTIGYQEADWLVRKISEKFGKPTSISTLLLQNKDDNWQEELFKYGMGSAAGVDATSRLGMGLILPDSIATAAMPGSQSLLDAGKAVGEAITDPSTYNVRKAITNILPNGVVGVADRNWFSKDTKQGEMAISRDKVNGTAIRNETDKTVKTLGATGLNESKQKKLNWELSQTDRWYDDKRKDAVLDMKKAMLVNEQRKGDLGTDADWKKAYGNFVRYQGDPNTFQQTLERMTMELNLTQAQLNQLRQAGSSSITNLHKLLRSTGKE